MPERLKLTDFDVLHSHRAAGKGGCNRTGVPEKTGNSDVPLCFLSSACYRVNLRGHVTLGLDLFYME